MMVLSQGRVGMMMLMTAVSDQLAAAMVASMFSCSGAFDGDTDDIITIADHQSIKGCGDSPRPQLAPHDSRL